MKKKQKKKYYRRFLVALVIFLGSIFLVTLLFVSGEKLGDQTKTSLVDNINNLKSQINKINQCVDDNQWTPREKNVCKYVIFERTNLACKSFRDISQKRLGIGRKNCCQSNFNNAKLCPGDDIFTNNDTSGKVLKGYLVENDDKCTGDKMCEYYCDTGYHFIDEEGKVSCEKDCLPRILTKSACSVSCGGGTREVTRINRHCEKYNVKENCGMEACGSGWKEF